MGKHTISPPDEVYLATKNGIEKEKAKAKPRFKYTSVTGYLTECMRKLNDKYNLKRSK